ncbi:hypothetical protein N7491_009326 [Penicillium cf. griseofulvum]|uniref:Uncharacterized protein n=1 Tax=Penicillium cf. griseofulvum TaxID=2972120 RepID=A0A9W9JNZ8_9EURO|nr:hypothetical protein N7472_005081 [Penicillium cf. griseofulvum]KAJ5424110.1 hypothetical protein N7491_009326 [Penicillium cf. griseofulvum]KAJ5442650.1 hypothetical protein N7445_005657 [Penicillium cf. griseofulvum]
MPQDKGQNRGMDAPAARARNHATQKATHSEMGPSELLSEHMDSNGNPVPDPSWGPTKQPDEDVDLVEAMTADTEEFDHES